MQDNKVKILFSKINIATSIAIIFHIVGLVGILFFDRNYFIELSALNLMLMGVLIVYTQKKINIHWLLFFVIIFSLGMVSEIIGVNTGKLFGNYEYGNVLGPKIFKVPLIIGVNWFVVIYCSGVFIQSLVDKLEKNIPDRFFKKNSKLKLLSVIIDGALLTVLFDWLMEPVALQLGFWQWHPRGSIPFYNYVCWFTVAALMLFVFNLLSFEKHNKFAVNLLLIQAMFFLILRTCL